MDILKQLTNRKISELKKSLREIDLFLRDAPKGTLKIQTKKNRPYYYWQLRDKEGKLEQQYLAKKEAGLARTLAQKRYYERIKPIMEGNIDALLSFQKKYQFDEIADAYENLSPARKELIVPYEKSIGEIIREWNKEVYEPYQAYHEMLRFETDHGEFVRSKSELIIANLLHQHEKHLLYKYERPLHLSYKGRRYTLHPDFTVLNIRTGKIIYWEHAGLMDNPKYASEFVWKNNLYYENKIVPGKDVVFSYESQSNPLDIGIVKSIIKNII